MTNKFKEMVAAVVLDGEITPEERQALIKLAEEEKIKDHEAQIYISIELKKIKIKKC